MAGEQAGFEVDTQLFRELGELLVGRDSTALAELVKNSYDADATEVFVYGENLKNGQDGSIVIRDNGIGMTSDEFRTGFLTIASRIKTQEENRISPTLHRRVTGAKGIGRLAAHKLASVLQIESSPHPSKGSNEGLRARIDWNQIEALEHLGQVSESNAIWVEKFDLGPAYEPGTTITLTRLRRNWTDPDVLRFSREMAAYQVPRELLQNPDKDLDFNSLLGSLYDNASATHVGLSIHLSGDFESGESYSSSKLSQAGWLLEIKSDSDGLAFNVCEIPNREVSGPSRYQKQFSLPKEAHPLCPSFVSRIYFKKGTRAWEVPGVALYMEGFRVFPYGEAGNDWLDIDKRYTERTLSISLPAILSSATSTQHFMRFPSKQFFGGILLTVDSSDQLQMLVNREGFVANDAFSQLVTSVKIGIDLLVRALSEVYHQDYVREHEQKLKGQLRSSKQDADEVRTLQEQAEDLLNRASEATRGAREKLAQGDLSGATQELDLATTDIRGAVLLGEEMMSDHRLVAVLAGIGTQLSAFTHDIRQLLAELNAIETVLREIHRATGLPEALRSRISSALNRLGDTKRLVEHQAHYLADVVSTDARRKRSRLPISDCFERAERFLGGSIAQQLIAVQNEIPPDLTTPPMFRSELSVVFANLLSNAIKASGEGGRIRASARLSDETVEFTLENTGVAVDLKSSDRLFEPFVSSSSVVNPELGQGTGLGLTIVKSILSNNDAKARFVDASEGFATAITISWRRR